MPKLHRNIEHLTSGIGGRYVRGSGVRLHSAAHYRSLPNGCAAAPSANAIPADTVGHQKIANKPKEGLILAALIKQYAQRHIA